MVTPRQQPSWSLSCCPCRPGASCVHATDLSLLLTTVFHMAWRAESGLLRGLPSTTPSHCTPSPPHLEGTLALRLAFHSSVILLVMVVEHHKLGPDPTCFACCVCDSGGSHLSHRVLESASSPAWGGEHLGSPGGDQQADEKVHLTCVTMPGTLVQLPTSSRCVDLSSVLCTKHTVFPWC